MSLSSAIVRTEPFVDNADPTQRKEGEIPLRFNRPWQQFFAQMVQKLQELDSMESMIAVALASSGAAGTGGGAVVIIDTHAARGASYPASAYADGTLFYETDRTTWYVAANSIWRFVCGLYVDVTANMPIDLVIYDFGFNFLGTDTNAYSKWTGAAWVESASYTAKGALTGSRLGKNGVWFEWVAAEAGADASIQYDGTRLILTGAGATKPVRMAGTLDLANANYTASKVLLTDGSKVVVSDAAGVTASHSYVKGLTFTFGVPDASGLVTLGDVITWAQNLITALGGAGGTVVNNASASGTVATTAGLVTTLS